MAGHLRIGLISRYPPVHCGVGEYTRMLASGFRSYIREGDITVFSSYSSGPEEFYDEHLGVRVIPCYSEGEQGYSGVIEALESVGGVDVLHLQHEYGIFGYGPGILRAMVEAREKGLSRVLIATMHTVYHALSGFREAMEFQGSLDSLDAVIVHSHLQEFELQAQGVSPEKIRRIPHGTLINPYLGYSRSQLISRLGLEEGRLRGMILVVPGALRRDKGLDVLFEALDLLLPQVTVIVAGENWEKVELPRDERTIIVEKYLSHDEILMLSALSDAIILPYRDRPGKYSVSGILHLSMGSLKPIIGTRVPRLVELYENAPRLTVPPRTPKLLASKLNWLSKNYDAAVVYSSALFSYAARTQWPRMAKRHLQLYRNLLEEEREWDPLLGEAD